MGGNDALVSDLRCIQCLVLAGAVGTQSLSSYRSLRAFRHGVICRLVAKVGLVELSVMAAVRQQLGVAAVLNDFAVCHNNDAACGAHGGEAVSDHNTRAAFEN